MKNYYYLINTPLHVINIADNQQSRIPNERGSGGRKSAGGPAPVIVDLSKSRIKDHASDAKSPSSIAQSDATMSTNAGNYSPNKGGEDGDGRLSEPDYEPQGGPPRDSLTSRSRKPVFRPEGGVEWANLTVEADTAEDAVIGHGSFGVVIRGRLMQQGTEVRIDEQTLEKTEVFVQQKTDVAVKVLTRAQNSLVSDKEFQKMCDKAFQEVHVLQEAESRMLYRDCIIRTFGIARGQLPDHITSLLGMRSGVEGVGIVMKFEGGGSLEAYLSRQRSMGDKLRVLEGIARGLTELHGLGIIHSDIKPENILLSTDKPPEVRLADFGLSVFRNDKRLSKSSLVQTTHSRGTPIYFAPEMLMNPYQVTQKKVIAQSSRKTDIYAFALLAWEVLSQNQAFFDVDTEGELCAKVHQGYRPPVEQLPKNTPTGVVALIKSCWDTNRQRRHTAVECLCTLQFYFGVYSKKKFDVFYSHSPKKNPISLFLLQHLIRLGYRVWFDQG